VNFRKLYKIACVLFFLICIQGNALAATIHGTVYEWYSFKPLENSIIEINSTPEQSFVATDAQYSFNLTPGTYLIIASYFEENTLVYRAREEVIVSDEGEYIHDLLLFPAYQEDLDLLDQGDFENVDLDIEEAEPKSQESSQYTIFIFALLALCILLLAGYIIKKERRNPPEKMAGLPGEIENPKLSDTKPMGSENLTANASASGYTATNGTVNNDTVNNDTVTDDTINNDTVTDNRVINEIDSIKGVSGADYEPSESLIVEEPVEKAFGKDIPAQQIKLPDPGNSIAPLSAASLFEEEQVSSNSPEDPEETLPEDLKEIMNLIRANGNRITQRELRKKSPYSESKVSLMLSDLEERGLVEKFKRGRGNIIRIPDGEILKQTGHQNETD